MKFEYIKLGDFIERSTINNKDEKYGIELIAGVNNEGVFTSPKGNPEGVNLKPYKIVNNGAFVYNPSRLDLGSIAYRTEGMCIVSHLYIVFYLNEEGKKRIDPLYLFMYIRRQEFYREVRFGNFGSQRPEFNFNDMSEIKIPLPPIDIQRKYVAIYKAMVANLQSCERGLEDLKLVCDAYIEDLRRKNTCEKIGQYITRRDERNSDNSIKNVMGISVTKEFRLPTSKVKKDELASYKIVRPNDVAFVQTTHNEKVFAFAYNSTDKNIVVSSVNEVFFTDAKHLLPDYLSLYFMRKEFDRYARFHSWGSARETFTWEDILEVEIPIPDIEIQRSVANIYKVYMERKQINEHIKAQIKNICPILIRGAVEEGKNIK